jgi:hypothetical protein
MNTQKALCKSTEGFFMSKEKYGMVYIWRDKKHNRYYIGAHWGRIDDGYICSSSWMKKAYKNRPKDFHRRILATQILTREETFTEEFRIFKMIKPHEVKTRYYNLNVKNNNMWYTDSNNIDRISKKMKGTAAYKDLNGKSVGRLSTDHPMVLSGEYVGHNSGRKMSEDSLENLRRGHDNRRVVAIRFLEMTKTVLVTELQDYLDQGWTIGMTDD